MGAFQFDCDGLAQEWDGNDDIRARIRRAETLVVKKDQSRDASISQCTANMDCLQPMLHRFYACRLKLPEINRLREECASVYAHGSRQVSNDTIDDDGWELRKMLRFIKRKANREEVSLET